MQEGAEGNAKVEERMSMKKRAGGEAKQGEPVFIARAE
jgi:hypothetical protein